MSLMELIGKPWDQISTSNPDSLLYDILDFKLYAPSQFFISEIASEKINSKEYSALRQVIFEWNREYEQLEQAYETLDAKTEDDMIPYLVQTYPLKDIDQYGPLKWKSKSQLNVNKAAIFNDVIFESHLDDLLFRVITYQSSLQNLDKMQHQIMKMTSDMQ